MKVIHSPLFVVSPTGIGFSALLVLLICPTLQDPRPLATLCRELSTSGLGTSKLQHLGSSPHSSMEQFLSSTLGFPGGSDTYLILPNGLVSLSHEID